MTAGPSADVRVRIAPSPTGYFHVGTARTALYNWCVARQNGGAFILRIEDTDRERHQEEQYQGILDALEWLAIPWDEGPYRQSERGPLYAAAVEVLWDAGALYACACTREMVEERTRDNPTPGYDGFCRERGLERGPGRALRFRAPDDGVTVVHDLVRGEVEFANSTIEDFVVQRSNGEPLFVLAVVADDREMRISHVIRAEEHLPTAPKAVLVWEALNRAAPESACPLPAFAHLPVLVNAKRQKISKRRDRVALEDFRAQGFLPEAIMNYLALLGWSFPGGREFFTREEMVSAFRLEEVTHSPAFFDEQKMLHFNGVYIRALSGDEFTGRCRRWAEETGALPDSLFETQEWSVLAPLAQERVAVLSELPGYFDFLADGFSVEADSWAKAVERDPEAPAILKEVRQLAAGLSPFSADGLRQVLETVAEQHDRRLGKTQAPVRVATLGRTVGLPLFESLEVLGRDAVLSRLDTALERASRRAG